MSGLYLEPIGILHGSAAREAVETGTALPLAGGPAAFLAARVWDGEPGSIRHAIARISTLQSMAEPSIQDLLIRLSSPRAALAGLHMSEPLIMGIVNVTPDSFSDGGQHGSTEAAIAHGNLLASQGADILDVGGESTRPGADTVPDEEELRRTVSVVAGLTGLKMPVSIDTRKPAVMKAAVAAGASIVNDVSGLTYASDSVSTAAMLGKPVIIMHSKGDPKTMQADSVYRDVVVEVYDFLEARIEAAIAAGIPRSAIVADPGIGFAKTLSHNLRLIECIGIFHGLGVPLLLGASRKGLIRDIAGIAGPKDRVPGSIAAVLASIAKGVQIVRVHDVSATRQAISVWNAASGCHEGDMQKPNSFSAAAPQKAASQST